MDILAAKGAPFRCPVSVAANPVRTQLAGLAGSFKNLLQFCTAKGRCVVCHQPGTALLTIQ